MQPHRRGRPRASRCSACVLGSAPRDTSQRHRSGRPSIGRRSADIRPLPASPMSTVSIDRGTRPDPDGAAAAGRSRQAGSADLNFALVGDADLNASADLRALPVTMTGYVDHVRRSRRWRVPRRLVLRARGVARLVGEDFYDTSRPDAPILCVAGRDNLARGCRRRARRRSSSSPRMRRGYAARRGPSSRGEERSAAGPAVREGAASVLPPQLTADLAAVVLRTAIASGSAIVQRSQREASGLSHLESPRVGTARLAGRLGTRSGLRFRTAAAPGGPCEQSARRPAADPSRSSLAGATRRPLTAARRHWLLVAFVTLLLTRLAWRPPSWPTVLTAESRLVSDGST